MQRGRQGRHPAFGECPPPLTSIYDTPNWLQMRFTKPILLAVVAIALATYASDRFAMSTPDEAMQCCDTMPCSSHGFYWLSTNKEHNSSAALFIFQLLRSVVYSIFEHSRHKAIRAVDCALLYSSGRDLLGKVEAGVERPCRDGVSS
jgi:hypothetical protein